MADVKTDLRQGEVPGNELRLVLAVVLSKTGPIQVTTDDVVMLVRSGLFPVFEKNEEDTMTTFRLEAYDGL